MKILISACLLGVHCRYDAHKMDVSADIQRLLEKHAIIPFCPEVYGGLTTPRAPCEIREGRVYSTQGVDLTEHFVRGAQEARSLAVLMGCSVAVLKERSPSCGSGLLYDGTFCGVQIVGDGITAALLKEAGMSVFGESQLASLLE